MEVYKYEDYDDYIRWQKKINKSKKGWIYVKEKTIENISKECPFASQILCHGTRAGAEQKYFLKYLPNAEIIGTEIGDNALEYKMTIQHDFNKQLPEFINRFDIVYSNSFDHSINPKETLKVWGNQLNNNGKLFLEFNERDSVKNYAPDPVYATNKEIEKLLIQENLNIIKKLTKDNMSGGVVFVCKKG